MVTQTMIKINKLEVENVKRVKAVKIEPTPNGLTIIGGPNNQGKTSILDSIAWGLGGNKYKPSQAHREGSMTPPHLHIVMSNGLIVERKGKNSDLKVIDPNGEKGGQQLLNSFVEELAIDLPKFMDSPSKEKANTLLQIIGVCQELERLEKEEQEIYNRRLYQGQEADRKKKFAEEQTYYPDAPKELVSAADLVKQQEAILARNGENQRKRGQVAQIEMKHQQEEGRIAQINQQIQDLTNQVTAMQTEHAQTTNDLAIARTSAMDLQDESTAELQANLTQIDEINRKVRANLDKDKAETDASELRMTYDKLTAEINNIRTQKADLLLKADLPLPELAVENGELIYKGQQWDNMSGSDQLKVSTAIVRKLKPDCGFILLDKLEQMDLGTLEEFGKWLEQEGLQAIATRVSTGDECSIIIEDGYVVGQDLNAEEPVTPVEEAPKATWQGGGF